MILATYIGSGSAGRNKGPGIQDDINYRLFRKRRWAIRPDEYEPGYYAEAERGYSFTMRQEDYEPGPGYYGENLSTVVTRVSQEPVTPNRAIKEFLASLAQSYTSVPLLVRASIVIAFAVYLIEVRNTKRKNPSEFSFLSEYDDAFSLLIFIKNYDIG